MKVGATVQYEQDYLGGLEYRKVGTNAKRLEAVYHDEGRYYNLNVEVNNTLSIRYEYSLRDHLGNTRLTFTDRDANGIVDITNNQATSDILQENHYYPFGMTYEGPWLMNDAARDTKYQYNGKELNDDFGLNWMDYGARWYDAAIARWISPDPLSSKYPDWSPYNYTVNNPIRLVDKDGREPKDLIITGTAIQAFKDAVSRGSGGFYKANVDNNGKVALETTGVEKENDGMLSMTGTQSAFVQTLNEAINSTASVSIETVNSDPSVTVGDIVNNKVDMADISEFDKAGSGGASSSGVLAHEVKEQQLKAEAGGVKGTYPVGAMTMHRDAIKTENKVNGNIRVENTAAGTNTFYEKDKTKTSQTVTPNQAGSVTVTKTIIP